MKRGTVVGLVVAGAIVLGVGGAFAAVTLGQGVSDTPAAQGEAVEASPAPTVESEAAESDAVESEEDTSAGTSGTDGGSNDPVITPGAYVDYSADALASAQGDRILFFHADWCPTCRTLEADIESQGVPDGITVLKVDYDSNQELRQKYGVTVQTTVVALDDQEKATALFVPYDSPTLGAALAGLNLR